MVKVEATIMSRKLKKEITELGRIAIPGEEFEVTEQRFEYLSGSNPESAVYVLKKKPVVRTTKKKVKYD